MRLNNIMYITEHHGGALLNALGGGKVQFTLGFCHECLDRAGVYGVLDLVAADVGEADGCTDINSVNDPPQSGMPVNTFQQAACRRGCHAVVADTFGFHLGPAEQCVVAADIYFD